MIKPHGSETLDARYVADEQARAALAAEAEQLPSLLLNSAAAANAVMLGGGYFNPLAGYMNRADALTVARELKTADGLFWPVPVLNLTADSSAIGGAQRIALRDPNVDGHPIIAVQTVESIETLSEEDVALIIAEVFGTSDENHPGVATFKALGRQLIAGPIQVLNFSYFERDFPDTFRTATQIRAEFAERGWNKVVAFQTRNPMHRAHEELCRMAYEELGADGILIHMLLGQLKPGDIPAPVRDASIRKMVDCYFPANTVMITGYGFDMLYAGPREAVLHAVFRQNAGCTHLIVGRDHAGVVAAHDQMRAAGILAEHRMQHGLARPGVEHVETVTGDHHGVGREIAVHHLADRGIAHRRGDVAGLELAQQHVDQDAVGAQFLVGHAAKFFVRAVHGVAGLEGHHLVPTALGKLRADLGGGAEGVREITLEIAEIQHLDRPGDQLAAQRLEGRHAGVVLVAGAEDLGDDQRHVLLAQRLDALHGLHGDDGMPVHIGVAQGDALGAANSAAVGGEIEHRHRPEQAVGGLQLAGHGQRVGAVHVAGQRIEITAAQHHRVSGCGGVQQQRRQLLGLGGQGRAGLLIGHIACVQGLGTVRFDHLESLLVFIRHRFVRRTKYRTAAAASSSAQLHCCPE